MMNIRPQTLTEAACDVLNQRDPVHKVRLTYTYAKAWQTGRIKTIGNTQPPNRPARPDTPKLCDPGDMPKRSTGLGKRRTAFIHAIAHIELNAIDLGWDMVARFSSETLPKEFYDDWVKVAKDEARHFEMLEQRLNQLDSGYGKILAHDGLWEAAQKTHHDILARLVLVPMVLEARGLDTTPKTVTKLRNNGDDVTADIMTTIAREEIDHVAAGVKWFEHICNKRNLAPVATFKSLLVEHYKGDLKPPFNTTARDQAHMSRAYYE